MEAGVVGEETLDFGLLNYGILAVYLAGMVGVGWAFAGKQKTTEDYFLAGRNIPWIAVAISVFASITSAVSYIGVPGLVYNENFSSLVGFLMMPAVAPFIVLLFFPFYRKLNVTTSYDYINKRFGRNARFTVSALFLCARIGWLGSVIFAPAVALSVVTGIDLIFAILLMGLIGTAYTALGGLAAVIWTDVAQFAILVGGAVWVSVALVGDVPGGFDAVLRLSGEGGRLNLTEWGFDLRKMTVSIIAISYFCQFLHDYGVDQLTVQRLLATKDYAGMVRATFVNAIASVGILGMLGFIGLGLYAFAQTNPGIIPEEIKPDQVFPYYIVHALPVGVSGLVITGVFAAAMSSVDSGINSVSTVLVNDFIRPLRRGPTDETHDVRLARILTVVFGGVATVTALLGSGLQDVVRFAQTFIGLFSGPVLALFLIGILVPWGTFAGWSLGAVAAIGFTLWVQIYTEVHFVYYFPTTFLISFLIGAGASLALGSKSEGQGLTFWERD
jgi:SSS family transporter